MSALAAASSNGSGSWLGTLLFAVPVVLLAFMFWSYFKRQKQFQRSQASLTVGDEVSTTSGLYGTLVSLDDELAVLEVSKGVQLRFDRRAVVPRSKVEGTRPDTTAAVDLAKDETAQPSDSHTDTKA